MQKRTGTVQYTHKSVYQTKCVRHLLLLLLFAKGRALYYTHSRLFFLPFLNIAVAAAAAAAAASTHNAIRMRTAAAVTY